MRSLRARLPLREARGMGRRFEGGPDLSISDNRGSYPSPIEQRTDRASPGPGAPATGVDCRLNELRADVIDHPVSPIPSSWAAQARNWLRR